MTLPDASSRTPDPARDLANPVSRVALVVDGHVYGGAEAYVVHLVQHLPAEYACTLVATEPVPPQLRAAVRAAGAGLVLAPAVSSKVDLAGQWGALRALRLARPDLVHLSLTSTTNQRHVLGLVRALRRPVVATLHTHSELVPGFQHRIMQLAYGGLQRVIAVSAEIAGHLRQDLGVPAARIHTIGNGVPARPMMQREHVGGTARIGAVGRLTGQKGFDVLVQATRGLLSRGLAVELVIAGVGPEQRALEGLCRGLPVRFVGFVDDVPGFMSGIDVLCLPSRWEGLPFVLLEGMMSGLPCVATAVGDMPEVLDEVGELVPPDDVAALTDALDGLIQSPERRRALGRAAHQRVVARYPLGAMVDATARVYQEALTG